MKPKLFLALDLKTKEEAFSAVEAWEGKLTGFKVGPRLGFQMSTADWKWLSKKGQIFIDYKFFDIPSVVEESVRAAFRAGASFCTVHALSGAVCLKRLAKLEAELNQVRPFQILAVSLLTSFDQEVNTLPLSGGAAPDKVVNRLVQLAYDSGIKGFVCSAHEVSRLKKDYPMGTFVTPGIRFGEDSLDDQKRVMTPAKAWAQGSDYLVMGRSLVRGGLAPQNLELLQVKLETEWQKGL